MEKTKLWKYKVAAINIDSVLKEKESNIKKLLKMVEEAAKNNAKLIAMPEMATVGYCWFSREEISPYVEPVPGPTTDAFGEIAKKYDCYIVIGMPEVDPETDAYYNTAVLVGPEGVIGIHRKSHVYISEPKWCKQGDIAHHAFKTPIGNIALLVCMDIHFIETVRLEGLDGADVIVHTSAWYKEKCPAQYWIQRAFDNGAYLIDSNRIGLERTVMFSGGSCVINPDGTIQSYIDEEEGICYGEVDLRKARSKKLPNGTNKFLDRRPKDYIDITTHPYLWNPLEFFTLYGQNELPTGMKFDATVVQNRPVPGDIQANMKMIKDISEDVAQKGSKLVVFPELTLTGLVSAEKAKELAQDCHGEFINFLLDITRRLRIYIVAGMVEKDGDCYYNTAVVAGPDDLPGKYRKMHLSDFDKEWATPGNLGFIHCNTPLGRIGLMIGQDAMFPESGRMLALQGVDIICCPSAVNHPEPYGLPETTVDHKSTVAKGYTNSHWHMWRVRAGENNSYLIFANQIGEYPSGGNCIGCSGIFSADVQLFPRNEVILSKDKAEIATLTIDTTNIEGCPYPTNPVRRKELLSMRQPLWYDPIVLEKPVVLDYVLQED